MCVYTLLKLHIILHIDHLKNKICLETQLVYHSVLMSLHDISVLYMTEVNKLITDAFLPTTVISLSLYRFTCLFITTYKLLCYFSSAFNEKG